MVIHHEKRTLVLDASPKLPWRKTKSAYSNIIVFSVPFSPSMKATSQLKARVVLDKSSLCPLTNLPQNRQQELFAPIVFMSGQWALKPFVDCYANTDFGKHCWRFPTYWLKQNFCPIEYQLHSPLSVPPLKRMCRCVEGLCPAFRSWQSPSAHLRMHTLFHAQRR